MVLPFTSVRCRPNTPEAAGLFHQCSPVPVVSAKTASSLPVNVIASRERQRVLRYEERLQARLLGTEDSHENEDSLCSLYPSPVRSHDLTSTRLCRSKACQREWILRSND